VQRTGQGRTTPTTQYTPSSNDYTNDLVALLGLDDDRRASWRDDALCAQVDTGDIFYPPKGASSRDAKRLCGLCEVRQQCLDFALTTEERYGIWGGLSERERRRIRQATVGHPKGSVAPINHGTESGYKAHRRRGEQACVPCRGGALAAGRRREAERGAA
jgi:WhiB family redox-sensing transcriptional regulator